MLRWRLIAAALIVFPLFALIWLDDRWNGGRPGIWLGPLAMIVGLLACHEVNALFRAGGHVVAAIPNLLATSAVLLMTLAPLLWTGDAGDGLQGRPVWTLLGLGVALAIVFTAELGRYREPGNSIARLSTGVFAVCYAGLLISFLIQLRYLQPPRLGLLAFFATMLIVKISDTGAYFTGKSLGRHKLAPRLSPGKTIEGLVGGILSAGLAAWLVHRVVIPYFAPDVALGSSFWFVIYGITLALAGVLGDLSESLLKRDVGQKDSSNWLPGLGGILDIIDSVIAAAPVSFAWWVSGLLVPLASN